MPIVRKPLLQRLAEAGQIGIQTYQGRKRAGNIASLLSGSDDPNIRMLADFVDPATGEVGDLGKNLLNIYAQDKRMEAENEAAYNRINYQAGLDDQRALREQKWELQKYGMQKAYEKETKKNEKVDEILKQFDSVTTLGAGGKIKQVKKGLLATQFGIPQGTFADPQQRRRLAETIVTGGSLPIIIPGKQANQGFLGFGRTEATPTRVDWNDYYNYPGTQAPNSLTVPGIYGQ